MRLQEPTTGPQPWAAHKPAHGLRRRALWVLLVAVLLLAAGLRFVGLDWDGSWLFHPDERQILMVADGLHWPRSEEWPLVLGPRSPLNPRFFAYGSLPIYLLSLLQSLLRVDVHGLALPARALFAACDLLTVATLYPIGRRFGGRRAGLLAAAFYAVAVLPIQLAHFATVEPPLTLFATLAVLALVRVAEGGSRRMGLVAGALIGLALACKVSALPLLALAWPAWGLWAVRSRPLPQLRRGMGGLAITGLAALAVFVAVEPYALIDWFRFVVAVAREGAMVRGHSVVPYTQQYVGTAPFLYPLRELVLWSLGLPLGLLALAGLVWFTWRGLRRQRAADLVVLGWVWGYLLIAGSSHAKFSRYLAPLIPWLCLTAALLLRRLWDLARKLRRFRGVVTGLGGAVLLLSALYALAFSGMYLRPHPWVTASDWLCRRVPAGATLLAEVWDDSLPARPSPACAAGLTQLWLDPYAPDGTKKLDRLVEALQGADYVVLASQRAYGALGRLPADFPLTAAYYRLLFAEDLGFRLVKVESNYPRLGPLALVDEPLAGTPLPRPALLATNRAAPWVLSWGRADESYSVYDHPRVLIFAKQEALPADELRARLLAAARAVEG